LKFTGEFRPATAPNCEIRSGRCGSEDFIPCEKREWLQKCKGCSGGSKEVGGRKLSNLKLEKVEIERKLKVTVD